MCVLHISYACVFVCAVCECGRFYNGFGCVVNQSGVLERFFGIGSDVVYVIVCQGAVLVMFGTRAVACMLLSISMLLFVNISFKDVCI